MPAYSSNPHSQARRTLRESCFVDTNSIVVRRGRGVRFSRLPRSGPNLPGEDWELVWRLSRRLRVRNVALAVSLARHAANGWHDPAIPDDLRALAGLLGEHEPCEGVLELPAVGVRRGPTGRPVRPTTTRAAPGASRLGAPSNGVAPCVP